MANATPHTGTIVRVSGTTVVMSHDGGTANDTQHMIADGATITLNGKAAELADLRAGDAIVLQGDPATTLTARR